jgi:hypothetical protein
LAKNDRDSHVKGDASEKAERLGDGPTASNFAGLGIGRRFVGTGAHREGVGGVLKKKKAPPSNFELIKKKPRRFYFKMHPSLFMNM